MNAIPFGQLPLDGQCQYHMAHGAPDQRSIRHLLRLVHDAAQNLRVLLAETQDPAAGMPAAYRDVWTRALQVYDEYQQWASAQLTQEA